MKRYLIGFCLSIIIILGVTRLALSYTIIVSYSFEGVDLETGPINIKPTGLVIIYGKPGDLVEQLKAPGYEDMFPCFMPTVDFYFNYDPLEGNVIFFRNEDKPIDNDSDQIIELTVLEDIKYNDIDAPMLTEIDFFDLPKEPLYLDQNDTLVVLTQNGKRFKIGNIIQKGSHLVMDISEVSIPEPSPLWLLSLGLFGLFIIIHSLKKRIVIPKTKICILLGAIFGILSTFSSPVFAQICDNVTEIPRTECEALQAIYDSTDGDNWTDKTGWLQTYTPCSWFGVRCEGGHVTQLHLHENKLRGNLPSEIGNLTELVYVYFDGNQLTGSLPSAIGNLTNLQAIGLSSNELTANIPPEIGNLLQLRHLSVYNNQLTGTIPSELWNLTNLEELHLGSNRLNGTIPPEIGNLTNLIKFRPHDNQLTGNIPGEIGNLIRLEELALSRNQFSGSIPQEIGNLQNLQEFRVAQNQLSGTIPIELGQLTNIRYLNLWQNQLEGPIPSELGNLTNIEEMHLSENQLSGEIPIELGNLSQLKTLSLATNPDLSGALPESLTNLSQLDAFYFDSTGVCIPENPDIQSWLDGITTLRGTGVSCTFCNNVSEIPGSECEALSALYTSTDGDNWTNNTDWLQTYTPCSWYGVSCEAGHVTTLSLQENQLTGTIPSEIADLSHLQQLWLHTNQLTGEIPTRIGELSNLTHLSLWDNSLTGNIPTEIGNLLNLQYMSLSINQLSGSIPSQLGNLNNLQELSLWNNQMSGSIPLELGNLSNLVELHLGRNQLSGNVPQELGNLVNLQHLRIEENQLTGTIPSEIENLSNLKYLLLHNNQLNGSIPSIIGNLSNLQEIHLSENKLTGNIPRELGNLTNLTFLGLWDNQLSGEIPQEIGNLLNLEELHLGRNQLTGSTPVQIGNLTNLTEFHAEDNQLAGELPAEIGNLAALQGLLINDNLFSGALPASLTNLTQLQEFYFQSTNLCEPQESSFQTWLSGVPDIQSTGTACTFCDYVTEIPKTECEALAALYTNTDGDNWTDHTDWLKTHTPCSWYGVTCEHGVVVELALNENKLNGTIPPEIGKLANLRRLYLGKNNLNGSIPADISHLINLQNLYMPENQLSGRIPSELGNLHNLIYLYLNNNQLSDEIPLNLENLEKLQIIFLNENQLSGSIPSELGNLGNLRKMYLGWNQLSGDIPSELGNLANMEDLHVGNNQLTGSIPAELGSLTNLTHLNLHTNKLNGEIPKELGSLLNLKQLRLYNNQLSGSLPQSLVELNFLEEFGFNSTNLCEPQNRDFQNWLANISNVESTGTACTFCDSVTEISKAECEALQALYNSTDGDNWTNNTDWLQTYTPCSWFGVTCVAGHVTQVALEDNNLTGSIPAEFGNLSSLIRVVLGSNQLSGAIPAEISNLTNLKMLYLYENQLSGSIPSELGNLSNLEVLHLGWNALTGSIPENLGNLSKLTYLKLSDNQLTGHIPTELGNLSSLQELYLFNNQLSGNIPGELSTLTKLDSLGLGYNQLSGNIPPGLRNLSKLRGLWLAGNQLDGNIPIEFGELLTLEELSLDANAQLTGKVPSEFGNLTKLKVLRLENTRLEGVLPSNLTRLGDLQSFWFNNTNLCEPQDSDFQSWLASIPTVESTGTACTFCDSVTEISKAECEALQTLYDSTDGHNWTNNTGWLQTSTPCSWFGVTCVAGHVTQVALEDNNLTGSIPAKFGDLANLIRVVLGKNQLIGPIPSEIGNLINLKMLYLYENQLSESIPAELGNLSNLEVLHLGWNALTGSIPENLGNLSKLTYLKLSDNQLTGTIPSELSNLANLQRLLLHNNQLSGTIPSGLATLTNLQELFLGDNQFTGTIPAELSNLTNLQVLNLRNNQLTGNIPSELQDLTNIYQLDLSFNQLQGEIPVELCSLTKLQHLFLNYNQLTGSIPNDIDNLTELKTLYLNNNQLSGAFVPEIGNLTKLEKLYVRGNQLSGSLPNTLTHINTLGVFAFNETNLCEPQNIAFQVWLSAIPDVNSSGRACTPADNLLAYYPFDDNADDESGKEQNGTLWGNITFSPGVSGTAASFGENDTDHIALPYTVINGLQDFTVAGFFKLNTIHSGSHNLLSGANSTVHNAFIIGFSNSSSWYIYIDDNSEQYTFSSNSAMCDKAWHHAAILREGDQARLFIDGILADSGISVPQSPIYVDPNGFILGNEQDCVGGCLKAEQSWAGNMDELRIYNRALTAEEIKSLYKRGFLCEANTDIPETECDVLQDLYNRTKGDNWNWHSGWFVTDAPCSWYGVSCEGGHVTSLDLDENNLDGEIPANLDALTYLQHLDFYDNRLQGTIPSELGNLQYLTLLHLGNNLFSGTIPPELGKLEKLEGLHLYENDLSGEIPSELGKLESLRYLSLYLNNLSGNIPSELGKLRNLKTLDLYHNQLSGSLPAEFGKLENLENLLVNYNSLSGALPQDLQTLAYLKRLYFNNTEICEPSDDSFQIWLNEAVPIVSRTGFTCSYCDNVSEIPRKGCVALESLYHSTDGDNWSVNTGWLATKTPCTWFGVSCTDGQVTAIDLPDNGLNGHLPTALSDIEVLERLDLSGNTLSGSLPAALIQLTFLRELDLSDNAFTGDILSDLGYRTNLETLALHKNQFTGQIPPELGYLYNLRTLTLGENDLSGGMPSQLGALGKLEILELQDNPQLTGSLPLKLSNLTALKDLTFADTNLCEPQDGNFQVWLSSIANVQNAGLVCDARTFTITMSAGAGGVFSAPAIATVPYGADYTVKITPDENYTLDTLRVDDVPADARILLDQESQQPTASYTFTNIQTDHTLQVTFAPTFDYFVFEEFGGAWHDVNKDVLKGNQDDQYCWAAVASNIMEWGVWDTKKFDSEFIIFENYKENWTEGGGLMNYAWDWWLDGLPDDLPVDEGWAQPISYSQGYWPDYSFGDWYADSAYGVKAMNYITSFLRDGYGVGITAYDGKRYHHAMTVWGYRYDTVGNITGLWITDSSDFIEFPEPTLHLLAVEIDPHNDFWYFRGGYYDGWNITGALALKRRTADGLAAHWKLDETSGTVAEDSSGNGHDGTIIGAVPTKGIEGGALGFTGNGKVVDVSGNFNEYVSDHFTITLWAKVVNSKAINYLFHANDDRPGIYLTDENKVKFAYKQNASSEPSPITPAPNVSDGSIPTGEWTHIACSWNGSNYRGYVNGKLVVELALPFFQLGEQVHIGWDHYTSKPERSFDGLVDDVRIYNRALSSEDIRAQAAKPGLVAHWKFDETGGNVVIDASGNGHDGTVKNYSDAPWQRTTGINSGGLDFTDGENYVAIPDDGSLSLTGAMTIESWVKFQGLGHQLIVYKTSKASANKDNYSLALKDDGKFIFVRENGVTGDDYQVVSNTSANIGKWHHVVGVYDEQQLSIYVDGVLENSFVTGRYDTYTGSAELVLGTNFFSTHEERYKNWSNFVLDNIRLYNRALSAEEIKTHATVYHYFVATAGPRGTIEPEGKISVEKGKDVTFSITPDADHALQQLLVDGINILSGPMYGNSEHYFPNVDAPHTIQACFLTDADMVTVKASTEGNGSISPEGDVKIEKGGEQQFSFMPFPSFRIANVIVDGVHNAPSQTFTLSNVTKDHDLRVQFVNREERLAILKKTCIEIDPATKTETQIPCDDTVNATITIDGQVVCDYDCDTFVGTFGPDNPLYLDSIPNDSSCIVRWETVYGTWLEDGVYFTEEDAVVNPVIGRKSEGDSYNGDSHGGDSHGGDSHGGDSHGGDSHGGTDS